MKLSLQVNGYEICEPAENEHFLRRVFLALRTYWLGVTKLTKLTDFVGNEHNNYSEAGLLNTKVAT